MITATDNKVVLITQRTRLENMIHRYNTESQAKFYLESHGSSFGDYKAEHDTYRAAVRTAVDFLEGYGRLQLLDRDHVPNYVFGEKDIVIAIGRDGLVANVLKYLDTQQLIGVNPDPGRWDGVLLPFSAKDLPSVVPDVAKNARPIRSVTIAEATLNDGQTLCGVNDIFIGQRTHASARYSLSIDGRTEVQSSSGIIVSTGLGSTGWLKSVLAGARGIVGAKNAPKPNALGDFGWSSPYLYYTVREPYPSASTGATIVFGRIAEKSKLSITSFMPENGVIFSDGVEQDALEFNSGSIAQVGVSGRIGHLVS